MTRKCMYVCNTAYMCTFVCDTLYNMLNKTADVEPAYEVKGGLQCACRVLNIYESTYTLSRHRGC